MDFLQMLNQAQNNPAIFECNPLFQRAMAMGKGKSEEELKVIIKNLANQRGINVDQLNMLLTPMGMKL